ncbi:MAG: glucose-6-phosphate isomerase [Nitrospina sp.]|jgi:glucose-6-phosphate isomerase|nr:glucose-6-phosphate isomerase [Nitrospina sp.]MBT3510053.1 glucose-6-phosphate isomerase [Nitrospina sp.]MBT3877298.1 glucose-6-phosphate isomerase [Nitrospina sp.]MBT4046831.1 glucose-6-phosphate isomerase [Nitrospina sp.]MBT4557447.1 glucose-6-phosphate isomerase [Nitrospina sp.]
MSNLSLNCENLKSFISDQEVINLQAQVNLCHDQLEGGTGEGADYLGWLHLPSSIPDTNVAEIESTARSVRDLCEAFIVVGIGGSYLGSRAGISFLNSSFSNQFGRQGGPEIYFAGQNISSDYHADLFDLIAGRDVCLNVISKSGTTTEPAIAFRLLKEMVENKYGADGARDRIVVTTDSSQGALKSLANDLGYKTFVIPDDVGGRYSVLTPVGLFPMAVAGINIRELLEGARRGETIYSKPSLDQNDAYRYAVIRQLLYQKGKTTEILATFQPAFGYLAEWWKQLAGESEGKNLKGIFPASVGFTSDLHSMGQWIQEGNRNIFETFLTLEASRRQLKIPAFQNDADGLNYLAGETLDRVNEKAWLGTANAHKEGGVPNMTLKVKDRSPYSLGQLFYFFERAVAMTGCLNGVNPFDQPGVEFYKENMFKLLGKPGI